MLFFSLLLLVDAARARKLGELEKWVAVVLREAAAAEQQQEAWAPADASIYERMGKVYDGAWEGAVLEQIAAAMQLWRGAGRWDGLTIDGLRAHKAAWKAGQLNGTRSAAARLKGPGGDLIPGSM